MQETLPGATETSSTPSFYLIRHQPVRPMVILLATMTVFGALSSVLYVLSHSKRANLIPDASSAARSNSPQPIADHDADDRDDPNQIDTIVLGDPADAPVPSHHGDHVSPVHPTIVVRLPRFGDQVGLIPNTPAGQLLYAWLAAFNQGDLSALGDALPNAALFPAATAQLDLRKETGGFNLLSAKEVQPGVLVFRLRDQTPSANEVLGTLQMRPNSIPAAIESFSLRAVPPPEKDAATQAPLNAASPK